MQAAALIWCWSTAAGGNAQDFTHAFTAQLTDRYRVFAIDRPGLGYTDRARAELNATWTTEAETPIEQARLLAAATRQLGAERPIVLGHSYGVCRHGLGA